MNEFQFYDASAAIFNTADSGTVSRPLTALRGNADLILFLIQTMINWVEGSFELFSALAM
jgi:hypothetical protein